MHLSCTIKLVTNIAANPSADIDSLLFPLLRMHESHFNGLLCPDLLSVSRPVF